MVGFLLGFPVLLCNAAMWLHIMYRPKEEVKCDNYVAESGTSLTVGRQAIQRIFSSTLVFNRSAPLSAICDYTSHITGEEIAKVNLGIVPIS